MVIFFHKAKLPININISIIVLGNILRLIRINEPIYKIT